MNQPQYDSQYFDELYQDNADPWQYETRWYEQRKRDVCLALLPKARYDRAIELGCSNGVFSELLAKRSASLLCVDGHDKAVALARKRLQAQPHVRVQQGIVPADLPEQTFDLVVISEILYYLTPAQVDTVIAWLNRALNPDGTLLCCHWRYAIEGFELTGDTVHARLQQGLSYARLTHVDDQDFVMDIWQHGADSVAMREGLVS